LIAYCEIAQENRSRDQKNSRAFKKYSHLSKKDSKASVAAWKCRALARPA
jgi:hypothetical protein